MDFEPWFRTTAVNPRIAASRDRLPRSTERVATSSRRGLQAEKVSAPLPITCIREPEEGYARAELFPCAILSRCRTQMNFAAWCDRSVAWRPTPAGRGVSHARETSWCRRANNRTQSHSALPTIYRCIACRGAFIRPNQMYSRLPFHAA